MLRNHLMTLNATGGGTAPAPGLPGVVPSFGPIAASAGPGKPLNTMALLNQVMQPPTSNPLGISANMPNAALQHLFQVLLPSSLLSISSTFISLEFKEFL